MAPKGGGGGGKSGGGGSGKSGGSASCPNCTRTLRLSGHDWEDPLTTAFFAINVLVALTLIVCLILQTRFKWLNNINTIDKRNKRYRNAALCLLFSYCLYITDLALHEENVRTNYLYYLLYIFASLFWRISELLILVIIYRTIAESSITNLAQKLNILHKFLVLIIALVSATAYGFYVAQIVQTMRGTGLTRTVYDGNQYADVAYYALYLVAALLAGVESLTIMLRNRSKATLIMLAIVTPALILHTASTLLSRSVDLTFYVRPSSSTSRYRSLRWACSFISDITNAFIYLGVVLIGFILFRKGGSKGVYVGGNGDGQFVEGGEQTKVESNRYIGERKKWFGRWGRK